MNYFFAIFLTAKVIAAAEPSLSDVYSLSDSGFESEPSLSDDYSLSDSRFKLRRNATWHKFLPQCWGKELDDDEAHEVFDKIIENFVLDHVLTKDRFKKMNDLDSSEDSPEDTTETITEISVAANDDWFGNNLRESRSACIPVNADFYAASHRGNACLSSGGITVRGKVKVLGITVTNYSRSFRANGSVNLGGSIHVPGGKVKTKLYADVRRPSVKVCVTFDPWWGRDKKACTGNLIPR